MSGWAPLPDAMSAPPSHEELVAQVAPIIMRNRSPGWLAEELCRLMDSRALTEWADALQADPHALPPSSAWGVAKRG